MLTGDHWKTAFSSRRSTCKLFNAASKDKDLWKFCLYSYKVRLKVLNLKLRSSERGFAKSRPAARRPTAHGPRPGGPRPTAHGPRPTAHGPRPAAHLFKVRGPRFPRFVVSAILPRMPRCASAACDWYKMDDGEFGFVLQFQSI